MKKLLSVLSGGERGRLALCKLLLEPYNLLLMDEPTNHLDIRSKEVLKSAIQDYEGTVIMVSHDRDFMKGICDRLFEFRDGKVREHLCDIEEFMQLRKVERLNELDLDKKTSKQEAFGSVQQKAVEQKPVVDKTNDAEKKQLLNKLKKTEENIEKLELEIKLADEKLADQANYEKLMNDQVFFTNYSKLKLQLEEELTKWEEVSSLLNS